MKKIFLTVMLTLLITCQVCFANLKVTMLNVGHGDAVLIQTSEQNVLIDTSDADERKKLQMELYKADAYRLDKIILTHPHSDHIANCAWLIQNGVFKVKKIYDNGIASTSRYYQNYMAECVNRNVPHESLKAGDVIDLGDGVSLKILWLPPELVNFRNHFPDFKSNINNESLVGLLTYGNFSMLLTGDAESDVEAVLNLQHVTVLKAGHHGSKTSSTADFLKMIKPEYVLISAGEHNIRGGNVYGHPHIEVLRNYLRSGVNKNKILWTAKNGTITIDTDGISWSVTSEFDIDWLDSYLNNV